MEGTKMVVTQRKEAVENIFKDVQWLVDEQKGNLLKMLSTQHREIFEPLIERNKTVQEDLISFLKREDLALTKQELAEFQNVPGFYVGLIFYLETIIRQVDCCLFENPKEFYNTFLVKDGKLGTSLTYQIEYLRGELENLEIDDFLVSQS